MQQDAASPERPLLHVVRDTAALLDSKLAFWDAVAAWQCASATIASTNLLSGPIRMTAIERAAEVLLREIESWELRSPAEDVFALHHATATEVALAARVRHLHSAWQPGLRSSVALLDTAFTAKYRLMLVRELATLPSPVPSSGPDQSSLLWLREPPEAPELELEEVPVGDNADVRICLLRPHCVAAN